MFASYRKRAIQIILLILKQVASKRTTEASLGQERSEDITGIES